MGPIVRWIALPAVVVAFGRCAIGAAALWGWRRIRPGEARAPIRRDQLVRIVASGVVLAVHWTLLFAALDRAPVGSVLLIVYLAPVFIAIGAPLIGERVPTETWVALGVAVAGTALVASPDLHAAGGLWFALASAVAYAVVVLIDKTLAASVGGLRLANGKLAVAAIVLVPFLAFATIDSADASWGWLVVLGLVHTAFGLAVILDVLGRIPATAAAVLLYLEPAAAVLFGWWLLGEQPTVATLIGGLLIAAAGLVVGWTPARDTMPA